MQRYLQNDEGKLRVFRSRTGGNEWEPLGKGLPDRDCYVSVLWVAMPGSVRGGANADSRNARNARRTGSGRLEEPLI